MSGRIFGGSGDLKYFFFYFENVEIRDKEEKGYFLELLSYLYGPGVEFYLKKFTEDGSLKTDTFNFKIVEDPFFRKLKSKEDPQQIISRSIDETLNIGDLFHL